MRYHLTPVRSQHQKLQTVRSGEDAEKRERSSWRYIRTVIQKDTQARHGDRNVHQQTNG